MLDEDYGSDKSFSLQGQTDTSSLHAPLQQYELQHSAPWTLKNCRQS